jgi:hypothetical protein
MIGEDVAMLLTSSWSMSYWHLPSPVTRGV